MQTNLAIDHSVRNGTLIDFQKLIAERTGLFFSERKWNMLNSALNDFCKKNKFIDMTDAYKALENHLTESDIWKNLISKLTINETFFFRHFSGIENRLIPQVIQQTKQNKQLRIWSAGCSSGEEPYSIAMVLMRLIPDIQDWKIHILATDIDTNVLEQARKGIYREWSMRQIRPYYLNNYFKTKENTYHLDTSIRKMVHFEYLNLKDGSFPSTGNGTSDLDMIFCRNVTIYFEAQETIKIAGKFFESLKKGGKLVVGHSEPSTFIYDQYRSEILDDIVIYNKDLNHLPKSKPVKQRIQPPRERRATTRRETDLPKVEKIEKKESVEKDKRIDERRKNPNIFEMRYQAMELIEQNKLGESVKILEKLLVLNPKNADLYFIMAYVKAKLGEFDVADSFCQRSLNINKDSTDAVLLRAIIAREQWQIDDAKKYLHRLILKDATYLPAYLELFQIAHMEDKLSEQKRLAKKIEIISDKLKSSEKYDILEGMTVQQIKDLVKVMVQE